VATAAERRTTATRAIPVTPAAKAAALSREANSPDDPDVAEASDAESLRLAEEGPTTGRRRWLKGVSLAVVLLVVLVGGGYAAYDWSQRQYFVGENQGHVAIYRGVSQNIGPWKLSHVVEESDIALSDLPAFYRAKVDSTVTAATRQDAQRRVGVLRVQALECQTTKIAGGTCDPAPGPTSSATPTATRGAIPTPRAIPTGTLRP